MNVKNAQYIDVDYDDFDDMYDESYADDFEVDINDFSESESDDSDEDDTEEDTADKRNNDEGEGDNELVLELKPSEEFVFTIPEIPGAIDISNIYVEVEEDEGEKEKEPEKEIDQWDWESRGHKNFLQWMYDRVMNVPKHSGRDVAGLERAIAIVERILQARSKAMRTDYKGEIDVNKCEEMSDNLYKALDRMEERKNQILKYKYPNRFKNKKTAEFQAGLVKEGQKATHINGITVTVPLLISRIARTIVNGVISAGHDLEDMYDLQKKEFDLTKREEAEVQQLLADMGYPIYQDRGLLNQQVDKTKSDNFDWAANYNA